MADFRALGRRLGIEGLMRRPAMKSGPGPCAVPLVDAHQPTRRREIGRARATMRPAWPPADLAGQQPASAADVVGEPDGITELGLQRGNGTVDLDVLGVAVLAPWVMREDVAAAF